MYDLVILDSVGMAYTGSTTSGVGGSEHAVIKLAKALSGHGLKVLVRNNTQINEIVDNVQYENHQTFERVECRTLLLQRFTPFPTTIDFNKLVVQVHDMPGYGAEALSIFFRRLKATLVCNSSWQRSLYPENWISEVIPPMFHRLVDPPKDKDVTSFIFASAALKGFDATLDKWQAFRNLYSDKLKNARLYVMSSGYDAPRIVYDSSVIYLGTLNDDELQAYIGRCAGMFYVNMFQETFCATAAIAEQLETRTHILCLGGGFGALPETLSDHRFLTDDHDQFRYTFLDHYGSDTRQTSTKDYRPATTLSRWLRVLGF